MERAEPREEKAVAELLMVPAVVEEGLAPQLGVRKDAPTIAFSRGAKRQKLYSLVADPMEQEMDLAALESGVLAKSSEASAASTVRTWVRLHHRWSPGSPTFPFTDGSIHATGTEPPVPIGTRPRRRRPCPCPRGCSNLIWPEEEECGRCCSLPGNYCQCMDCCIGRAPGDAGQRPPCPT